jgi:hypothetical protein
VIEQGDEGGYMSEILILSVHVSVFL